MIDYLFDVVLEHGDRVENGTWFDGLWGDLFLILYNEYGAFEDE